MARSFSPARRLRQWGEPWDHGDVSEDRGVTDRSAAVGWGMDLARRIAANPPLAPASLKEGLRRTTCGDPHDVGAWAIANIHRLFATEDHREGVRSFLEKRPRCSTAAEESRNANRKFTKYYP